VLASTDDSDDDDDETGGAGAIVASACAGAGADAAGVDCESAAYIHASTHSTHTGTTHNARTPSHTAYAYLSSHALDLHLLLQPHDLVHFRDQDRVLHHLCEGA
jgi:hypothetical protein